MQLPTWNLHKSQLRAARNGFLEGNRSLKVSDLEKIRLILSKPFARDTRAKAKQLYIFVKVSALLTLCLCSGGINAHAVFWGLKLVIPHASFHPGASENGPFWRLVSQCLLWCPIGPLSEERILNLSPSLGGIGHAAQGWFDMARAPKGSTSDAVRLTAAGQLAKVYQQLHSNDLPSFSVYIPHMQPTTSTVFQTICLEAYMPTFFFRFEKKKKRKMWDNLNDELRPWTNPGNWYCDFLKAYI